MLARPLTDEEYMQEKHLPDLDDLGFRFVRGDGTYEKDDEYRHKTIDGLRITTCSTQGGVGYLYPVYETEAKINRYLIGDVKQTSPHGICCQDERLPMEEIRKRFRTWTEDMFIGQGLLEMADYQLSLPDDLKTVRKMMFEFPDLVWVTLSLTKNRLVRKDEREWIVVLEHFSARHNFTVHKFMGEQEFNAKGIRYWFRMIKKWYKEKDNPSFVMSETLEKACQPESPEGATP